MKYIITALLSVLAILWLPNGTPVNNSTTEKAKATTVQVQAPEKALQQEATTLTEQKAVVEPAPVEIPETPPEPQTGEADAKAFIYQSESSNNPTKENSIGCYGLGQDCNGIVKHRCGTDYTCQDSYFTDYMLRRYGTWQAAKSFWLARVPINGRDVGNWW